MILIFLFLKKKPISQIVKEVRDFANFHHYVIESSIAYKDDKKVLNALHNEAITFDEPVLEKKVINRNIKYIFANDSWVLLRCSGTEPVLRIFVEMENKEKAGIFEPAV